MAKGEITNLAEFRKEYLANQVKLARRAAKGCTKAQAKLDVCKVNFANVAPLFTPPAPKPAKLTSTRVFEYTFEDRYDMLFFTLADILDFKFKDNARKARLANKNLWTLFANNGAITTWEILEDTYFHLRTTLCILICEEFADQPEVEAELLEWVNKYT